MMITAVNSASSPVLIEAYVSAPAGLGGSQIDAGEWAFDTFGYVSDNSGDNAVNSLYSGLASSKQDTLISNSNIKTVNGTTLLGSGDITQTTITGNAGTVTGLSVTAGQTLTVTTGGTIASGSAAYTSASAYLAVAAQAADSAKLGGSLPAAYALVGQSMYIGTTAVAINRGTGALTLAGITLTTPDIGTPSAGVATNLTGTAAALNIGGNAATVTNRAYTTAANAFTNNQTITKTTEQLRLAYDVSNYNAFTVGSTGSLTLAATGTNPNITLTPGGTGYTILNGNVGYVSSSLRYKKDISDMENISWLYDLHPVNFIYKSDDLNRRQYGLIAEEVNKVNPLFVSFDKDGRPETVNYSYFAPVLIKAVQEQQNILETHNLKLETQDTEISGLTLKTDENVTTISELKISTDKNLAIISQNINDINSTDKDLKDQISVQTQSLASLQVLMAQIDLNTNDITYIKFLLGIDRVKNPGDVDILGQLSAVGVETGTLTIKIIDKDSPTIGTATIKAGEAEVKVETEAIGENSKVFVTPENPVEIGVNSLEKGLSFKIEIGKILEKDLKVDWWIVEEK